MSPREERHHRVPRCLLRLHERATSEAGDLTGDASGIEAWLEFEHEAMRHGVPVEVSRGDLEALVEASAVLVGAGEHRDGHSASGDFARWGRLGGLRTLQLYGSPWFKALALRRWGRISPADLEAARPAGLR